MLPSIHVCLWSLPACWPPLNLWPLCFTQCAPADVLQTRGWGPAPRLITYCVALHLSCPHTAQALHNVASTNTLVINDVWGSCSLYLHLELCHCLPAYLPYPKLSSTNRNGYCPSRIPLETPGIEFFIFLHVVLSCLVHRLCEGTSWDI